jgi:D-cysteine desulfhydrase family pyridoxal phosphate-dependent enzyme
VSTAVEQILDHKESIAFLPTPIHSLNRLSEQYPSYEIFIKRDDQTGLASGGNKARKLEYLIKEALELGCDTVLTAGAQQSNHCRQTAAVAAKLGLECHLLLGGNPPKEYSGNLLLSRLLGATIHYTGAQRKGEQLSSLKQSLEAQGRQCFMIPYGGSSLTGALGFVNAMRELKMQELSMGIEFDHIVFASSSGGSQAGMMLGKELFGISAQLHPISIDKEGIAGIDLEHIVLDLVQKGVKLFGLSKSYTLEDCVLNRNYDRAGYGILTEDEIKNIRTLASAEGVLLDPVYTGRAFNGLIDMLQIRSLEQPSKILFWHTGGFPAIFVHSAPLLR